MNLILLLIINGITLGLVGVAFFRVELGGKLILSLLIVLSIILPFFFRRNPDVFLVLIFVTHMARLLVGVGCFTYLRVRGDI